MHKISMLRSLIAVILIVSQRWLFSLANKNISSKEGDVCDPESALWKATAIPHRFLSCHGVDRVYIANDCRVIYGKQKLFDEETQQCVFPPDVTLHSNKRFVTSTGNIHEVSHLDPNFMTSAEESRMKYFDESGIEDEIENIQLNFGTPSNFKPFVKFDKPQVENRLWKINTPSRKPFAIGEKDLTENNNESLNESRISQTVNVGNQPLLSKPRIVKVPLNRVNGSWKYANTCPERRRPMLYLGKDIPVICSRSSMERDSRNAAIILDDCNHADYRCTFSSDRDEYGICCQRLSYLQIQCTLQSRPLLLEVDRQNVNMMRQPVDCSPRHLCPTLKNFGNPACIFDMGDYHCCEYIEDHNHPLNSTQNGETYYETSVVINTKGVLRRSDDSSVTKVPSKVANFRKRKGKGTISPIFIPVHDHRNGCPPGEEPFRVPFGDNTILDCNETLPDQCPPGFSCYKQRNMRRQKARCCGVTNVCGGNSAALLNPENKISVKCNLRKGKGCPEPFFCYEQSSTCCSLDPVAGLCAYGMGQVDERGNAVSCDAQNPCVAGFVCTERFNKRFCCPTELNICTQPKNTGLPCILSPPQKSFYFDVMTGECEKFDHTGCYGKSRSDNRFETKEQCLQLCSNIDSSQICKDSRNQNPVMCDPLKAHQCSLGQQCVVYDHSGIGFCCAKKTPRPQSRNTDFIRTVHHNTVCPAGLTSKLPGVSNSPTFCDPNNSKSCPPFSRCDHSDHYQAFICCTSNVNNAQNLITDDIIYN